MLLLFYLLINFFRAKHPVKVHVWGGISCRGATALCIFEGIMDKCLYTEILEKTLLPCIHEVYSLDIVSCKIMTPNTHPFTHEHPSRQSHQLDAYTCRVPRCQPNRNEGVHLKRSQAYQELIKDFKIFVNVRHLRKFYHELLN